MRTASIAIPTRGRPSYLDVTLSSIMPQATRAGAEVLVISDGADGQSQAVAARHGAGFAALPEPRGANAARNLAIAQSTGDVIVFVDDDVAAPEGWLDALLSGIATSPDDDVFGGPIHARLEGGGPRACGREPAPITTLEAGGEDREVPFVWSANMAVRRRAFERLGTFDESIHGRGEEEEWERRYLAAGGRIRYLAAAGLDHRRATPDATVPALARAGYRLGRSARRNDVRKGVAPSMAGELRTVLGCAWHIIRRRCGVGIVMLAQAAGRLREALRPGATPPGEDFLSGHSGHVSGIRHTSRAILADLAADAVSLARLQPLRLRRAARSLPSRRVLVLAVERPDVPNLLGGARRELLRSRHQVEFVSAPVGERGKFENLNALLAAHPARGHDWLLVIDDDVALPRGFLDVFLFLAERFDLRLVQPAHRSRSHAAWQVTRRRVGSIVRQTVFVEIGPVTAFHASTFEVLLPFPELRMGWGLDAHWSALAREQGWSIGVVDATPVLHSLRPVASSYQHRTAVEEARVFLRDRPYVKGTEAQRTLVEHRSWQ